jgi:vancomycin permeability regulator SanA
MMNERIKKVLKKVRENHEGLVSIEVEFNLFESGNLEIKWVLYNKDDHHKEYSSFTAMEMDVLELGNDDEFMAMLEDDK